MSRLKPISILAIPTLVTANVMAENIPFDSAPIGRWKDGNNDYVTRANALENKVSLYYTCNGKRNTINQVCRTHPISGIRCG